MAISHFQSPRLKSLESFSILFSFPPYTLSIRKSFGLYLFKLSRIQPLPNPSSAIAILQTTTISHLVCSGLFLCFHPCSWKSILITADFVIPFKYKSDHNTPLLRTLQWILFFTKRKSQIFTMAYKALTWSGTHCFSNLSSFHSRHMGLFAVPQTCQTCFHLRWIPSVWNSSPQAIHMSNFLTSFKSLLLHHFVN